MTLSPVVSRTLALALVMAPIGAIYSLAVEPVLDAHRGYAETIERSRELIERYGRIGATQKPLERQLAELRLNLFSSSRQGIEIPSESLKEKALADFRMDSASSKTGRPATNFKPDRRAIRLD